MPSDHLTDTVKGVVPGIQLLWKGASYSTYDRPVPDLVESTLLTQFEDYFNQTQVGGVGLMLDQPGITLVMFRVKHCEGPRCIQHSLHSLCYSLFLV